MLRLLRYLALHSLLPLNSLTNHGITESRNHGGWGCVIRALEKLGNLGSVKVATLPLTKLPTLPISLPLCRVAAPKKNHSSILFKV